MTSEEALNALGELIQFNSVDNKENAHYFEVSKKILDKEVPFNDSDPELDKAWQDSKE